MLVRPQGERPGKRRGEIAEREPDPRMMRIERGHHHLADVAFRHRIAGAGPHDFEKHVLAHDHAFARRGLIGDDAEIGGGVGLIGVDPARL